MMRKRSVTAVVMSAALAVGLAACGGGTDDNNNTDGNNAAPAFDAANGKIFSESTKAGGTLKMAISEDWDSVDPGDTYYGLSWNFLRTYARTLTMFKPVPGKGSTELVGDLAEGLGTPSEGGKTWTYKLRPGLKF
jgi:peptide/nickel transport system substrate-binding protein